MAARRQECSICMDSFKNPKLISCHHSFCLHCLEDYVRTTIRNGRFNCPICRVSVELPKGGVRCLQYNFYIDDIGSGETFHCDLCGPKNEACSRCLDCEENFCQTCSFGHEKSKATRHHKIRNLGTLEMATKGKIRQRIFCDEHPEEEIKIFCKVCKVLICLMCKAEYHGNHRYITVAKYAAEIKKTLQSKMDECSDKLRRMNDSKAMAKELEKKINDAEREDINAVEEQHLQLQKVLEQEIANVKGRIKSVYHDLRQQIAVFKTCVDDELVTCENAQENVKKLADQGTDIYIIRNGQNLEQLISASILKADPTHTTVLKNKLFSPAPIDARQLIPLIGIMQDSTGARQSRKPSSEEPQPPTRAWTRIRTRIRTPAPSPLDCLSSEEPQTRPLPQFGFESSEEPQTRPPIRPLPQFGFESSEEPQTRTSRYRTDKKPSEAARRSLAEGL